MFGFLRLKQCGLSDAQRDLYHAHYCAGCHALAELGGRSASLLTNYDHTLLLLIASALEGNPASPRRSACTAMPLRRVSVQPVSDAARPVLAALNMAIVEAKLRDDVADERALVPHAALGFYRGRNRRAEGILKAAGFPYGMLETLTARQAAVEASPTDVLALAEPTAELLEMVFAFLAQLFSCPQQEPALRRMGRAVGRTIYLWDAVDDAAADARKGRFNALLATQGANWDRHAARHLLLHEVAEFRRAAADLPLGDRAELVLGVAATMRQKIDQALPAPQRAGASFPALRRRLQLQRGDCDAGSCDGCDCCSAASCDCCCSQCDDCACDCCMYECCCKKNKGCGIGGCLIALVLLVLVIIILAGQQHGRNVPPPHPVVTRTVEAPAPTATITRSPEAKQGHQHHRPEASPTP